MSYTPKVGDRVQVTRKRPIKGKVERVDYARGGYGDLVVIRDEADGLTYKVASNVSTFKEILELRAGDALLFLGEIRVRRSNGEWVAHSGHVVGWDSTYTEYISSSADVRWLVKGGKVVA